MHEQKPAASSADGIVSANRRHREERAPRRFDEDGRIAEEWLVADLAEQLLRARKKRG